MLHLFKSLYVLLNDINTVNLSHEWGQTDMFKSTKTVIKKQ